MSKSLLILSYGQSNADCHNAGPAFDAACLKDTRIVVPNDGFGVRGLAGRPRKRDITGFDLACTDTPAVQSIGKAAAARYLLEHPDTDYTQLIVRSSAKGGRPLRGFHKDGRAIDGVFLDADGGLSPFLLNMCEDVRQMVRVAADMGAPIDQVMIPFFHGEADRAADRDTYTETVIEMMDVIEARFLKLGLRTSWLMTQPSGTSGGFSGNAWASRMSVLDICAMRENAHFVTANYAYQLVDASHLNATAKALIGEMIGIQMGRVLHDVPLAPTTLVSAELGDQWIDLTFDGPHGIALVSGETPDPRVLYGFEIAGRTEQEITDIQRINRHSVRLHCALPLLPNQGKLRYAFSHNVRNVHNDGTLYPFGRGSLCEHWSTPSAIVPGRDVRRWVAGFELPVGRIIKNAMAA